ncbi:Ger(x)C family spore germination protein [Clostridium baratii]|uniref:Spore germination protein, gerKC n=1 Tax=Clostridium baratii TaxID=1561 RepID=A0A174PM66_9CLOT|nr:Ger(x)C family spore germination protein [Clostridium baratii]CUP62093.1 spore germination protein%2C gerKC [Clostridium baratii]
MKKKILFSYLIIILFFVLTFLVSKFLNSYSFTNIEDVDFVVGIGFDVTKDLDRNIYHVPMSIYNFTKENSVSTYLIESKGETPLQARLDRQAHSGRKFSLGSEKIYIFSRRLCETGLAVPLDGLLNNTQVTNRGLVLTTSQDPKEILSFNVEGYPSSSHYIENLIKSLNSFSYFSKPETLRDAYIENTREGSKFLAPNIDIVDGKLQLTSLSVLDKGKLVGSVPIDNIIYLNLLRNPEGTALLTYLEDNNNTISTENIFKRKIKCKKSGDSLSFDIKLDIKGKIVNNNYLSTSDFTPEQKLELEEKISDYIKTGIEDFITSMKTTYELDLLNLGNVAAAKFGRNKVANWDEEILESDINVSVNFKITKLGIGNIILD